MFVDTLPSPYYDMLIVNTFVEFGDLMYSVGRIEDEIKRGRIVDTGATTKGNVLNKHVEEPSRRKIRANGRICRESLSLTYSMYLGAPNQIFFNPSVHMEK